MAGIGFELRSVLERGGIIRFVTVSLAGTAIVAGPWLLSVLGIFLIQHFAFAMLSEGPTLFLAVVVYSYAFSLVAASGLHYVFSRWVSDLMYEKREAEAGSALLAGLVTTAVLSVLLGAAGVLPFSLRGVVSHPVLFSFSAVLLFVTINLTWVLMSFVSLLREYAGILVAYLVGSLCSFLAAMALGRSLGTAGALLGYALGQLLIAAALAVMSFRRFRPKTLPLPAMASYLGRYRLLFLTGLVYAWATWMDKILFWFTFGAPVRGSWLSVFDAYDIPVFFAVLTLIPGLLFFTVRTETSFYPRLREFLRALGSGTYKKIQEKKYGMIRVMNRGLKEQAVLQGVCTVVFLILTPRIAQGLFGGSADPTILGLTLTAVFFHSVFLSLMIFLFYFELYGSALISALVYFLTNAAVGVVTVLLGARGLVGASYLVGGVAGCAAAIVALSRAVGRMDRILFARSAAR